MRIYWFLLDIISMAVYPIFNILRKGKYGWHFADDISPNRPQPITWARVDQGLWCHMASLGHSELTHCGRVTHICVGKPTITGSDNGLSPGRRQAIIWTKAGILLILPLGTNFSEFLIVIHIFSFNKMHLKMSPAKWRPFCLGLNVLSQDE